MFFTFSFTLGFPGFYVALVLGLSFFSFPLGFPGFSFSLDCASPSCFLFLSSLVSLSLSSLYSLLFLNKLAQLFIFVPQLCSYCNLLLHISNPCHAATWFNCLMRPQSLLYTHGTFGKIYCIQITIFALRITRSNVSLYLTALHCISCMCVFPNFTFAFIYHRSSIQSPNFETWTSSLLGLGLFILFCTIAIQG